MMMDARNISICEESDCTTCAMTARIMEAVGSTANISEADMAERGVAISHAMARNIFAYARQEDALENSEYLLEVVSTFAGMVAQAIVKLRANDGTMQ